MMANCFRDVFQCATKHKLSADYSDTDQKLYGSDFAEYIGSSYLDCLLRKRVCVQYHMLQIHDRYNQLAVTIYRHIYDRYKVSQKNVKEGLAFAFLSSNHQLLGRVEETLAVLVREVPAIVQPVVTSNLFLNNLTDTLGASSSANQTYINLSQPIEIPTTSEPDKSAEIAEVSSSRSSRFKTILKSYLDKTSSSESEEQEATSHKNSTLELNKIMDDLDSFDEQAKHAFEIQLASHNANQVVAPVVTEPKKLPTRPIDFYRKQPPSYFEIPDSVEEYLDSLQHIKTELNYFHQLMRTNLPRFEIVKIGTYFKASCTLDFQTPQYYRSKQYKEISNLHQNSDHARVEAARKVLSALYRENPQRWREFLMIKYEKKIVC